MKEDLIKYKTAELAKKKGFDEYCTFYYDTTFSKEKVKWQTCYEKVKNSDFTDSNKKTAPSQALLQKWLREHFNIETIPTNVIEYPLNEKLRRKGYGGNIYDNVKDQNIKSFFGETYKEALEGALYEALLLIKN